MRPYSCLVLLRGLLTLELEDCLSNRDFWPSFQPDGIAALSGCTPAVSGASSAASKTSSGLY